jgi:alpha-galactosidase
MNFFQMGLSNAQHYQYAQPGQWNDPDYLLIGWVGDTVKMSEAKPTSFSPDEQYAYMSMWSLMAAPLIFAGDLARLDEFTINVLCNAEVIEVNQDPLGKQARIVLQTDKQFILAKDMEDGSKAVGLFNMGRKETVMDVSWSDLSIQGTQRVRDLWRQKDVGNFQNEFRARIPINGVVMVRLFPEK